MQKPMRESDGTLMFTNPMQTTIFGYIEATQDGALSEELKEFGYPHGWQWLNHGVVPENDKDKRVLAIPQLKLLLVFDPQNSNLFFDMPLNLKLTPHHINDQEVCGDYIKHGTYTVCNLTCKNGAKVTGVSGVIDPSEDVPEFGNQAAYQNASSKLWELEGYHRLSLLTMAGCNPNNKMVPCAPVHTMHDSDTQD
ncbi:hypothetical protein GR7B_00035 [Vibrio phage vB_VcorM_GR7B]|nr:hypothetical protein GR7B_00035 [Vibrio phage vB_VcorM_GR7B]